jgi:cell division protease FtsH
VTITRPLEDRHYYTENQLKDRLALAVGGRAAEDLVFGEVSTGAHNDLANATQIARAMVIEYGMSKKLGPISFARNGFRDAQGQALFPGFDRPDISDETFRIVDLEVAALMKEAEDRAVYVLRERKELLRKLADVLMERETLEGDQLKAWVNGEEPIPEPEEPPPTAAEPEEAPPEETRELEAPRGSEAAPTEEIHRS